MANQDSHVATVLWSLGDSSFSPDSYSRDHVWKFPGGQEVAASAATAFGGTADCVDPEQALTAAVSACHMLTFLALAAKKGVVVKSYRDNAEGFLGKNDRGRTAMTKIVLKPVIEFAAGEPEADMLDLLHDRAHKACFIANSILTEIQVVY